MRSLVLFLTLLSSALLAEPAVLSEKAARYHSLLLKRPKPGAIYERFASAWLEQGDITSLRTFLEGRANSAEGTTADRLVLGFFLSQQSEHDAAVAVFAKALDADPGNGDAWLLRAQAESRVGKHEDALKSLGRISDGKGETATDAAKLKARLLARTGKTDEALEVLKALANANLQDEDLQDEVVEVQMDEGLPGEAITSLKALLERTQDPYQRVLRRLRLGDILKRSDRRDDALAAYSQCLDDSAQDSWVEGEVLAQIEQTFRTKDDLTGLKDFLAKLATKHASRLALGQLRARVLLDLNEAEAAITLHRELVQKTPGNVALKESFIELLARVQKFEDAVIQCRELLAQKPGDKELRIQLATLLYQARKPGEAMKELQPLISDSQTPEYDVLRVARLYESFEDPQEARKLYQRAVDVYPASITAQDALANFMHAHKEKISAVAIWKKQAVAPAPKEEVLRVARALASRNEPEAALEVLQSREKEFAADASYLGQLITAASSTRQPELAKGWALALIKGASGAEAFEDSLRVVRPVFRDPKVADTVIAEIRAAGSADINERCLLAELLEQQGDPEGADKVLADAKGGDVEPAQRQQARLYVSRQDYEKAAGVLEKSMGARKDAGVIEQLVSLYQRASRFELAQKWSAEWKTVLPGSTRPWLAEARALQAQQKNEDAVKVLKLAARKFEDDTSMTVSLAEAFMANGQQADAQRVYQQLYDEAGDLPAQIRWAGQLAETARRRGTLKELLESFQERQRGNRTSIAPWLAIAEIHRRTMNYEGRRTAMLEASRLKPKDVDLLHQIARMDEEQGDWRKAIETLSTAASLDKTDKSRQRMAEVHLRYGDEETGLRMVFELGGGANMDPRDAEGMILGLMARGNWKMAQSVIDPLLNQNPDDYRLRYMKLLCLIEADMIDAAINEAVNLMGVRVEVLTPSRSKSVTSLPPLVPDQSDPVEQMVGSIVTWGSQALRYREELRQLLQSNRYAFSTSTSANQYYFLPGMVAYVKPQVTALLVRLKQEQAWDAAKVTEVVGRLAAAGHPLAEAVRWFEVGGRGNQSLNIVMSEVEKHLDNPQLAGLWMNQIQGNSMFSSAALSPQVLQQLQASGVNLSTFLAQAGGASKGTSGNDEKRLLNRIYDHYLKTRPLTAATAVIKLWQMDNKDLVSLDKALALAATVPVNENTSVYAYVMPLSSGADSKTLRTPEARKLRDAALVVMKRYGDAHPAEAKWTSRAAALHVAVGDWEAFVSSLEESAATGNSGPARNNFYFGGSVSFQPLSVYQALSAMDKMPYEVLSALMPRTSSGATMTPLPVDDAKALAAAASRLKDPGLRAIIAWRTGDKATLEAFARLQMDSSKPVLWPLLAMANEAATFDDPAGGAAWLVKARTATTQRELLNAIDAALVHAVSNLMKDGKTEVAKPFLQAAQISALALRRVMAAGSTYEIEKLAGAMESLQMKDEADRQRKLVASSRSAQRSVFSRSSMPSTDPYQISNDLRNGKGATAIPQAVRALRTLAASVAGGGSYNSSYEMRRWSSVTREHPAAAEDMWKELGKGEATSMKQKLERAVLADVLGHPEVAIAIYSEAVKTKPRDAFLRLRLAMLLVGTEEGIKPALEHLLAVPPADLGNEARSLNMIDADSIDLEARFNLVRVLTSYLQQVKSKAPPGELEWCGRGLDLLMTSNWGSGPRLPNMLEEASPEEGAARDLIARREKLFEEFCAVAVQTPDIAHHVLPAQFALARHRQKDTGAIVKRAKQALVDLAGIRKGGYSIDGDWLESYNGSWSGRRIWVPMVPEILLFDAHEKNQEKQFRDEIVPLIRQAYGVGAGNQFELRAKLWFCPESEFLATAKDMESARRRNSGGSNFSAAKDVVRVWSERGLSVPLDDLIASYAQETARRNYSLDSAVVGPYLQKLVAKDNLGDVRRFIKSLVVAMMDKPESEWPAFLKANPPPASQSGSTTTGSPLDRIRRVISACESMSSDSIQARLCCIGFLREHGFHRYSNFQYLASTYAQRSFPAKAADLVPALAASPYLADLAEFDVLDRNQSGYRSGFEQLADAIQRQGKDYSEALVEALQKHQASHPTFGAAILIGRLVELTPDLALTLQPYGNAFSRQPAARKDMLMKAVRSVWPDFDHHAVQSPSLEPFAAGLRQARLAGAEKLLAAKVAGDFEGDDSKYEKRLQDAVAQAVTVDPAMAQKAFEHGVAMLIARQAKDGWNGSKWFNGCNLPSGMLEKVCGLAGSQALKGTTAPGLEVMGMALRLYEQPEQRLYLCTYRENDFHWGEMMRVYWERKGGFGEPRKAVHALLGELKRVIGATPPALLTEAFRSMGNEMPRWYRAVVLEEAGRVAKSPEGNAAIAREMAVGFGLLSREADAIGLLKQRVSDTGLHPFTRPVVASMLVEAAEADLSASEIRQCLETTLPLLQNDWPAGGSVWSPLLEAFNRQPSGTERDALAKRFREAWMQRARLNTQAANRGMALNMQNSVAANVLEVFAHGAGEDELQQFYRAYTRTIDRHVDSVLILARHRRQDLLRKVLKANDGALTGAVSTNRTGKFQQRDTDVTAVIDEAMKEDARLAARGRLLAVSAPDDTAARPAVRRADRLKAEAARFLKDKGNDKKAGDPMLAVLLDAAEAATVLAPALLAEIDVKAEVVKASRASSSSVQGTILDVPLAVGLASLGTGDEKAWKAMVEAMRGLKSSTAGSSLWSAISYRVATLGVRHQREQGLDKTTWVSRVLRDVLDTAPNDTEVEAATSVHLMNALLRGEAKALSQWRQSIPEERRKKLAPQDPVWLEYCLDAMPSPPNEEGGKTLLAVLNDPWAREVTRKDADLRHRGKWPRRLTDETLRAHAGELLAADPGNLAVLSAVMDAWSGQKDRKPLLALLQTAKAKLDKTRDKKVLERIGAVEAEGK